MAVDTKVLRRNRIKMGIRKKISGTPELPRLCVFRSNKGIYAQLIDDVNGTTLTGSSSFVKGVISATGTKSEKSKLVGIEIAKKAKAQGIENVVFDRNGFKYHGRVKALAEGAREGGLKF